ncbi:UDP-N-acetylmuramoyl-L-alanine--D-glutamate ligase [Patescibacteria group bacterium]
MKYKDKKVAVVGFGIEGKDVTKHLVGHGAEVTVLDIREDVDKKGFEEVKFETGKQYLNRGLKDYEIIVRSPGVYRYIDEIIKAEEVGSMVTSPTEIFFENCPAKIIGVTGTKGKGTTATLIYEILKSSGKDVRLAGNIGKPFLGMLSKLNKDTWVVLELSSFQLIDLEKSPHISVVLNITTDHLDWHKDRNEYVNSKKSIVKYQTTEDVAVLNKDYPDSTSFSKIGKGKKLFYSVAKNVKGSYVKNGTIFLDIDKKTTIGDTGDLILRGRHNWENVCAAACASYVAGADLGAIKKTIFSFKGYEHRLEFVRELNGVKFYNDSAGTGPETAIAAINSYDESLVLIMGGFEKNLDYSEMAKVIAAKKSVQNIIFIGDIGLRLEKEIRSAGYRGSTTQLGKISMNKIVNKAFSAAAKGSSVLLAPATSSFDMFENYRQRGDQFKEAVQKLK